MTDGDRRLTGSAMPSPDGWVAQVAAELRHYGDVVTDALGWVPGWAAAVVVLALVALLARHALRQLVPGSEEGLDATADAQDGEPAVEELEGIGEEALKREYA